MKFIKTVISKDAPQVSDGLWAQPVSGGFVLYLLSGGRWVPLKSVDEAGTNKLNDDEAYKAVRTVEEGTNDGTVKVDGTNVKVHGLGNAAYANTTAFDAAGSAAAAITTLIGSDSDEDTALTLNGLKKYIDAQIQALG
jgi:hypothetical protein